MKKLTFIICTICLVFVSCSNDDSADRERDYQNLGKMYREILSLSKINSELCTDSDQWDFTAIGSKACGGSAGYIAYSKKIDKTEFLAKVKTYTDAEAAFNTKWNVVSTCDVVSPPTSIECIDGKPKLSYITVSEK
ncbi:hypothetical protein [Flavobacterium sp. LC2016-12]|uniref:hypothetical protein n=1 Tax=Flavobacterium sp. LC2016-12 TaxID=2783794 RepID=UPI00188D913A|nr:hypothetical protein [Flavobacterium sp. LC2016-12]MBF4463839.1 hypothetical protein [Flavobacterium sp. LC2016-12]